MSDEEFLVRFELDISSAVTNANRLSKALGEMNYALGQTGQAAGASQANLKGVAQSSATATTALSKNVAQTRGVAQSLTSHWDQQFKAESAYSSQMEKSSKQTALYNQYLFQQDQATQKATEAQNKQNAAQDRAIGQRDAHVKAYNEYNKAQETASQQTALYNQYLWEQDQAQQRATQNLSTSRYALYDAANALGVIGAALLVLPTASVAAAVSFERDFANVRRTAQVTGAEADELKNSLLDLSTTMPIAFGEITEIATLGGQLGIASQDLDEFTSVVARLAATTDLSAEAAGTMLGRFQALLGVSGDEFENLASSILKVGINSVATETQIVNIATQISSMGGFAGLTADQVVGLAGALASVGAAPELSRGTITRTFSLMSRAVAEGGASLERFASTAGVSGNEFAEAWGTEKFTPIFQSFLEGLGGIADQGENAVVALNEMGISSVRDVPLLMRLADAGDVVASSFLDAATGFAEAKELQDQYGIIAETTASKVEMLVNTITRLLATLGEGTTGPLSEFVGFLTEMAKAAIDFLSTDIGQRIGVVVLVVTAAAGALSLLLGSVALSAAGAIALRQAWSAIAPTFAAASLNGGFLAVTMDKLGLSTTRAAAATRVMTIAIKSLAALSGIGLLLFLPEIAQFSEGISRAIRQVDVSDIDASLTRVSESFERHSGRMARAFGPEKAKDFSLYADLMKEELGDLDAGLVELANSGNMDEVNRQLAEFAKSIGVPNDETLLEYLPGLKEAMKELGPEAAEVQKAMEEMAEMERKAAQEAANLAMGIGLVPEEMEALKDSLKGTSAQFFDYGDLIQRVQTQTRGFAEEQSKAAYGSKDSWQEFYDGSSVNIHKFMGLLDQQIDAQQTWAGDLQELTARGATAFVTELAKMGPEGAPLARAAVELTADELFKLEEQAALAAFLSSEAFSNMFIEQTPAMVDAYEAGGLEAVRGLIAAQQKETRTGVPGVVKEFYDTWNSEAKNKPLVYKIDASTTNARRATERYLQWARTQTVSVNVSANMQGLRLSAYADYYAARAQGGPVYGPGTSTSDSIPARLSDGEYVIRAASVRQYGTGLFDALNRGVARFANGGPVGRSTRSSGPAPGIGSGRSVVINNTVYYPVAEPTSKLNNRDLQLAEALL